MRTMRKVKQSDKVQGEGKTKYERNQNFNPLVSFLHGVRYKHLNDLFVRLAAKYPDRPLRVVDIGCAHAKNFGLLNERFNIEYVGIELEKEYADTAQARYGECSNFRVINDTIENHYGELSNTDVVIALETLEHIPEHIVVRVVEQISLAKPKAFICSVPNEVGPIVLVKNFGSLLTGYIRHREYKWSETMYAGLFNFDRVETHSTGHKGFDWRWLAQTIRYNMKISHTYSNPLPWLPKTLSFSLIFVCLQNDL